MTSNVGPGFRVTPAVQLVSLLGKGGMGDVWIADHAGLGARVVVKFLSRELTANPDALERFRREAKASAAVKSPHVVQVFDHGVTEGGLPFIVMELLEGRDLAAHVQRGPLPLADVVEIVTQAARALSRAHHAGIVHRDIKPENLFLCETGDSELFVKLLDFGIAKAEAKAGRNTVTGQVVGTPYYMSPEQIVGAPADPKMDLWALTAVAFEALTGRVAFDGETVGAITLAVHGAPPVPSRVLKSVSPEVDAWFARAFARAPEARFASAKELASSFRGAARLGPEDARDPMPSLVSLDGRDGLPSEPALPSEVPRGALAATHLSAAMNVTGAEGTRASRARAWRVVVPVLVLALVVVALGAVRAVQSGTPAPQAAAAPSSVALAPAPAPSSAAPSPSSVHVEPPPPVASLTKPASTKPPVVSPKPAAPKPSTKPKPGKYDDIQ